MKPSDIVTIKQIEPPLGGPHPLPPPQFPFDILLHARPEPRDQASHARPPAADRRQTSDQTESQSRVPKRSGLETDERPDSTSRRSSASIAGSERNNDLAAAESRDDERDANEEERSANQAAAAAALIQGMAAPPAPVVDLGAEGVENTSLAASGDEVAPAAASAPLGNPLEDSAAVIPVEGERAADLETPANPSANMSSADEADAASNVQTPAPPGAPELALQDQQGKFPVPDETGESDANQAELASAESTVPTADLTERVESSADTNHESGRHEGERSPATAVDTGDGVVPSSTSAEEGLPPGAATGDSLTSTAAAPEPPKATNINSPGVAVGASGQTGRPLPHLLARGESESARASRPVETDVPRLLHRVARAFQAAQQRGGEIKLRLNPPELGALKVELRVQDGVLTARLETETQSAKAVLMENLPALRERLAEQGIRVERFDVDLMQHQGQGPGARDHGPDRDGGRVREWESVRTPTRTADSPPPLAAAPRLPVTSPGGLNILI